MIHNLLHQDSFGPRELGVASKGPSREQTSSCKEVNINLIIKPSICIDSGGKLHGGESQEVDLGISFIVFSPHNMPTNIPMFLTIQKLCQ
jgi:hypothetical protein